jgi:hypothetical protein
MRQEEESGYKLMSFSRRAGAGGMGPYALKMINEKILSPEPGAKPRVRGKGEISRASLRSGGRCV